jgi:GrpB-like predicted nucleotidyltransferase (UPF0157 family)
MLADESPDRMPQRRDSIKIVPYSESWPLAFEEQRERVERVLRPWLRRPIEHIGSTSVPGLAAKSIIDMLACFEEYSHGAEAFAAMSRIGWIHAAEPDNQANRKWSFCFPSIELRTHHLHIFEVRDPFVSQLLAFRAHLRSHPDEAAEYARIKAALAAADSHDRPRYRMGKAPFIEGVLERLA